MDTLTTPNRLIIGETRVGMRPEPQTQPMVQPFGERIVVSIPTIWTKHHLNGYLAASSPGKEVSLRAAGYFLNTNLLEFAKNHYSFALESFVRSGNERKFSNHAVDIVVREFVHPLHSLNRVIACVQVNEIKNAFVHMQFFSKVSSITAYRQIIDRIIVSVHVQRAN